MGVGPVLRGLILPLAVTLLGACAAVPVETPIAGAIPSGSLAARGAEATGRIEQIGTGVIAGVGWRLAIFPSAGAWCTQLETQAVTGTGCGTVLPEDGAAFGSVSHDGPIVHGFVTSEAATVFLIIDSLGRVPATLLPLQEAGLEGQAFVGIGPADANVTHVMALRLNGEVLQTYELP